MSLNSEKENENEQNWLRPSIRKATWILPK
jgi:hypothetical protein